MVLAVVAEEADREVNIIYKNKDSDIVIELLYL